MYSSFLSRQSLIDDTSTWPALFHSFCWGALRQKKMHRQLSLPESFHKYQHLKHPSPGLGGYSSRWLKDFSNGRWHRPPAQQYPPPHKFSMLDKRGGASNNFCNRIEMYLVLSSHDYIRHVYKKNATQYCILTIFFPRMILFGTASKGCTLWESGLLLRLKQYAVFGPPKSPKLPNKLFLQICHWEKSLPNP